MLGRLIYVQHKAGVPVLGAYAYCSAPRVYQLYQGACWAGSASGSHDAVGCAASGAARPGRTPVCVCANLRVSALGRCRWWSLPLRSSSPGGSCVSSCSQVFPAFKVWRCTGELWM